MRLPTPYATITLVAGTSACWLAAFVLRVDWVAPAAGFVPLLAARGAEWPALPLAVPFWLTPLSATLVHGSLMHIFFNMIMLIFCGRFVEAALGTGRFVLLYVVGAYAAAGGQFLAGPGSLVPMIGASGAVSAIVAAQAMIFGVRRPRSLGPLSSNVLNIAWLAVAWIVLQLLTSRAIGGGIAIAAHIGGFAAGLMLAMPLLRSRSAKR